VELRYRLLLQKLFTRNTENQTQLKLQFFDDDETDELSYSFLIFNQDQVLKLLDNPQYVATLQDPSIVFQIFISVEFVATICDEYPQIHILVWKEDSSGLIFPRNLDLQLKI
jgi:hypothetical protein